MKNSTSIKVPKKYQHMIEVLYPDNDKGYWCFSKDGYYFSGVDYGVHIIREDTHHFILEMIKTLEPCECDDCCKSKEESTQ